MQVMIIRKDKISNILSKFDAEMYQTPISQDII